MLCISKIQCCITHVHGHHLRLFLYHLCNHGRVEIVIQEINGSTCDLIYLIPLHIHELIEASDHVQQFM